MARVTLGKPTHGVVMQWLVSCTAGIPAVRPVRSTPSGLASPAPADAGDDGQSAQSNADTGEMPLLPLDELGMLQYLVEFHANDTGQLDAVTLRDPKVLGLHALLIAKVSSLPPPLHCIIC